jgi:hypothetical protein
MGYYDYRNLPDSEREQLFQDWCKANQQDPLVDGVADDFLASLDNRFADGNYLSKTDLIKCIKSVNPNRTNLDAMSKADLIAIYEQLAQDL